MLRRARVPQNMVHFGECSLRFKSTALLMSVGVVQIAVQTSVL